MPDSAAQVSLRERRECHARGRGPASALSSSPQWRVPLADVVVDDELKAAVAAAVGSSWWSMGPRVEEFEAEFRAFCGARFAFAVANGTAALHLALVAVGCRAGDEVVLPSLNFVAAANTIVHAGAVPVFCDVVGEQDLNLDPESMRAAMSERTRAVIALHYAGFACELDAVLDAARTAGAYVIEDAAHAPGTRWRGRMCGTLGHVGCFSFFSNKNLPIGEGGMVVTDDEELAERLRLLRSHGMTSLTWDRHRGHASSYDVVLHGFNYRLDEVRAAIGLVQLRRLQAANAERARIASSYRTRLHETAGITMPFAERVGDPSSAHHLAVMVLPTGVERDVVRKSLADTGIQTSVHYPPIHRFAAFRAESRAERLPRTEDVAERILTLPLFPTMTEDQVGLVVDSVLEAVAAPANA